MHALSSHEIIDRKIHVARRPPALEQLLPNDVCEIRLLQELYQSAQASQLMNCNLTFWDSGCRLHRRTLRPDKRYKLCPELATARIPVRSSFELKRVVDARANMPPGRARACTEGTSLPALGVSVSRKARDVDVVMM